MTDQTKTLIAVYNLRPSSDPQAEHRFHQQLAAIQAATKALYGHEIEFIEADARSPFTRGQAISPEPEMNDDEWQAVTHRLAADKLTQAAKHAEARGIERRRQQAAQAAADPAPGIVIKLMHYVDDETDRQTRKNAAAERKARAQARRQAEQEQASDD